MKLVAQHSFGYLGNSNSNNFHPFELNEAGRSTLLVIWEIEIHIASRPDCFQLGILAFFS